MTASKQVRESRGIHGRCARWLTLLLAGWVTLGISCRKQAADEPGGTGASTTSSSPADSGPPPLQRMDSQDDPAAPRALPRSGEVQTWIKTEAIRVATVAKMASLVSDPAVARMLSAYKIDRVSASTYTCPNATARALLVEAASPADAFGAFSMLAPHAGCTLRPDNSLRSVQQSGKTLIVTAWQGKTWLRFDCALEDADAGAKACERLIDRTVFALVAADPPLLVQAVRDVKMESCESWLVRSAALLTRLDQPTLRQLDAAAVNDRLGLTGEAALSVVAIKQTADSPTLVIWMAEYPTAEAAKAAADRYTKALQPTGDMDKRTAVAPAKGKVVVGTWTANQEGQNLVKMLGQALPE